MKPKFKKSPLYLSAIVLTGMALSASADIIIWDGAGDGTTYEDGDNWGGTAPADSLTQDIATFTGGSVDLTSSRSVAGLDFNAGSTLTGAGTLSLGTSGIEVNGNSVLSTAGLDLANDITITFAGGRLSWGSGTLVSGSGKVTLDGNNTLYVDGTSNTYSGGTQINAGATASVKGSDSLGTGVITLNGGTLTGNGATPDFANLVTVNAAGGILKASGNNNTTLSAVVSGTGQLTIGSTTGTGRVVLANSANNYSGGTVVETGGILGLNNVSNQTQLGTGAITLDGGTIVTNGGNMAMGTKAVVLTANGGTVTTSNGRIGFGAGGISGTGNLTIDNGNNDVFFDSANVGFSGSLIIKGTGKLGVKGGGSLGDGSATNNIILQDGGQLWSNSTSTDTGSVRTITLINGGKLAANGARLGVGAKITGTGGLTISIGNSDVYLDNAANDFTGGIIVEGSKLRAKSDASLGAAANKITMNGGLFQANTGNLTFNRDFILGTGGTFTANGTTTINGTVSGSGSFVVNDNAGTMVLAGTNTYTGDTDLTGATSKLRVTGTLGSGSYAGVISGAGTFEYAGSGTQVLTNISSYTGTTTVTSGKLVVNGNISTSSLTTVAAAGTLGGSGTVGKTVVNGTLAIGESPGTMTFTDTLTLAGTTVMEIDGTAGAGVTGGNDFANLTGSGAAGVLTYGGVLTLDIGTIFGSGSYSWNLFDMASTSGSFAAINLADQYSGSLVNTAGVWNLTSGTDTWQFTESTGVLNLTVIPEPSATLLGGLGLLVLLRRRRG